MSEQGNSASLPRPVFPGMTRREFIGAVGGAAAAAAIPGLLVAGTSRAKPAKPNVIYIFSDTHRWCSMSFTETPQAHTPHMAAMKRAGANMNHCFSSLPICTPYRAMVMSGRWPWQTGMMANHMVLSKRADLEGELRDRATLGHMFRDAGYRTGYFGKLHLGSTTARRWGFEVSRDWPGENHGKMTYRLDDGVKTEWTREKGYSGVPAHGKFPAMPDHKYKIIGETDQALRFIKDATKAPDGRPFFVMLSLQDPHGPWRHHPPHTLAYYPDEKSLPFRANDKRREWKAHRGYHASVTAVDDELGRILATLDELGVAKNTIVVYTSDHGGMNGAQGVQYGQKRHPEDESVRVPFLIRWPGRITANVDRNELFSTIDIFPTLCSLANIPAHLAAAAGGKGAGAARAKWSREYLRSLPGLDFSPNLLGKSGGPDPDSVFIMHPSNMNNRNPRGCFAWRGVVSKKYTYAVKSDREHCLYDRKADPYQMKNLVADPNSLAVRKRLWAMIDAWMDKAERPFYDNWFARIREPAVTNWNAEHGLGKNNADRQAGKKFLFDLTKSRPG